MDREIDLRQYVGVLLRYWLLIVGTALVATVTAFALTMSSAGSSYSVQAVVAVARSHVDFAFERRIEIVSDNQLSSRLDLEARRGTLVRLVSSTEIATRVLNEIGDHLAREERTAFGLLQMIRATGSGDLVVIEATHTDLDTAVMLANTWAQQYERYINELYGSTGEANAIIALQVMSAEEAYHTAQAALEAFLVDNRISELEREIASRQALLDSYEVLSNLAQIRPVELQLGLQRKMLADAYEDLELLEQLLIDAQSLRAQVEIGAESEATSFANTFSLIMIQTQAMGGVDGLPVQLQIDLTLGSTERVKVADVDALIDMLETSREATQERIEVITASLTTEEPTEASFAPDSLVVTRIAALDTEIMVLEAELGAENANYNDLVQARDLSQEMYQMLQKKQLELEIASQFTDTEVRVASLALPEARETGQSRDLRTPAIGAVLGLVVGVCAAFALDWWRKGQSPRKEGEE